MINKIQKLLESFFGFLFSTNFIIMLLILIVLYHFFQFIIRDNSYKKSYNNFKENKKLKLEDLRETPLINIIVPAWNEGAIFRGAIESILNLNYPKIKVIINAGGKDETINIANSFKKYSNFTIIYQEKGKGKIKAINDCLKYVNKDLIYLIDADIYLNDEIILQMLYPLEKLEENIVKAGYKPHRNIEENYFVKYSYINRNIEFRKAYTRSSETIGPHTLMKVDVIEKINKFSEKRALDDGLAIGMDLTEEGFKILSLTGVNVESFNYPLNLREYFSQNLRWLENFLFYSIKIKKINVLKFCFLFLLSIFLLIFPFLSLLNVNFLFFGLLYILNVYLKKIRKGIFLKNTRDGTIEFNFIFFIIIFFFIYLDAITNIIVAFEMTFYKKAYKTRKNLI